MLIPWIIYGVTENFTVTLTIREAIQILFSENVNPSELRAALKTLSWQAISVSSVSFGADMETPPVIAIAERNLIVFNGDRGKVSVLTFTVRNPASQRPEFFVGGYIAKSETAAEGVYRGSTTVEAIFQ